MGPAKASLEATVRLLAAELGPEHKIRVNAISPGPIHTLSSRGIPGFGEMYKEAEKLAPLGRNVTIEEVGEVATFLASEAARGMTGQVVYVDGGVSVVGGGGGGGGGGGFL
jgi:enoyl-[acyl-carrier protein] reductase I